MKKRVLIIQLILAFGASIQLDAGDDAVRRPTTVATETTEIETDDPSRAESHRGYFTGLYAGADIGSQNVFSGAFIDGIDVLTQDTRTVVDLSVGWSKELANRFAFGGEVRYGILDGDLTLSTLEHQRAIHYTNSSQFGYRLWIGRVFGGERELLIYTYFGETQRDFDILIETPEVRFGQRDQQGGDRFGLGLEKRLAYGWNLRATAGTLHTDFGGLVTSTDIDEDIALAVGLTYRFRQPR